MSYQAVIVETRVVPGMKELLFNFFYFLGTQWNFVIYCSPSNKEYMEECTERIPGVTIKPVVMQKEFSFRDYNNMLTDKKFWMNLSAEKILIFQHDCKLLRHGIDRFLKFDYVGAPWKVDHIDMEGGNGGLSIRSRQKMIDVIEKFPFDASKHGNEDVYFCKHLPLVGGKLPNNQYATEFSVETVFYPKPIGIHAAWRYLNKEQYLKIIETAFNEIFQ